MLGLPCCVGSSLVAVSRGYSLAVVQGFSLRWLIWLWSPGSGAQAQQLWSRALVALWHEEPSWTRDGT